MVTAPFGNNGLFDVRGNISGPLGDKAAISFAAGKQQRDGYTENSVTGNDLDYRDGTFAKAQLLLVPNANWEARVIYAHERNRDGDYALGDLSAIRTAPFRVTRDFEGFTNRDINHTTREPDAASDRTSRSQSTTGFVKWNTEDETDLDYTPLPLATRDNLEEEHAVHAGGALLLARQRAAGARLGDAEVAGRRRVLQPGLQPGRGQHAERVRAVAADSVPGAQMHSPEAAIDTTGIGLFGRATISFNDTLDLTAGLRFDHEQQRRAPQHLPVAGDRAGERGGRRAGLHATCRRSSRSAIASGRSRWPTCPHPRLQGGRLQPRGAAGQRSLRRRARLACRGGVKTTARRRQGFGERGGVLDRLG